jgi:hypothetical protein
MSMVTSQSEQRKTFLKKTRKKGKNRKLFSIPKPIPTENRHLRKKTEPDPDRIKKVKTAGLYHHATTTHSSHKPTTQRAKIIEQVGALTFPWDFTVLIWLDG